MADYPPPSCECLSRGTVPRWQLVSIRVVGHRRFDPYALGRIEVLRYLGADLEVEILSKYPGAKTALREHSYPVVLECNGIEERRGELGFVAGLEPLQFGSPRRRVFIPDKPPISGSPAAFRLYAARVKGDAFTEDPDAGGRHLEKDRVRSVRAF